MTDRQRTTDAASRARRDAIRTEYAAEDAEADAAENDQTVVSVRLPVRLAESLKARAAAEAIPTSTLIRRTLTRSVNDPDQPVLTIAQVEEIARRVMRDQRESA